jgi:hypothetical protein
MFRSIKPIWDLARLYYYRWALAEIDPQHPDVPAIVRVINELEAA